MHSPSTVKLKGYISLVVVVDVNFPSFGFDRYLQPYIFLSGSWNFSQPNVRIPDRFLRPELHICRHYWRGNSPEEGGVGFGNGGGA